MADGDPLDTLRLRKDALQGLVNAIEAGKGPAPANTRRVHERRPYVDHAVVLTISDGDPARNGGMLLNPRAFLVCSRNLSRGGVGLLHGGFLHPGTWCQVRLRDLRGAEQTFTGRVAACRHVTGRVHEVGIRFEKPLEIDAFTAAPAGPPTAPDAEEVRRAEQVGALLPSLSGAGIVLVADPVRRARLEAVLAVTGMEPLPAGFLGAALDHLQLRRIDLIVCGFDLAEADPVRTLVALRRASYTRPILGMPGFVPLDERFDRAIAPGAILRGQTTNAQLMDALRTLLPAA